MIKTKRFATLLMTAIALMLCRTESAFAAEGSGNLTRVRMGLAARSTTSMPFFVAKERGFFREEGLEVELIYLSLKAKVIDATPLQMPLTFTAQDEGYRKLVDAGSVYRSVQGGLATTKSLLSEQPELVTKVVRAMLRAIRLIKTDRKYGIDFIKGPWVDIGKDPEKIAARVYDVAAPALLENGSVDEDVQRQMIADASVRVKPAHPVLPEQVFDFSIVRKVSEALR